MPARKGASDKPPGRASFPHRVSLRFQADGVGFRLAPITAAAGRIAGAQWSEWPGRDHRIVIGFAEAGHADTFRAWILQQGWADLLA